MRKALLNLNSSHIDGSPFEPKEVFVSSLVDGLVDIPYYFDVDASRAGSGKVEIKIAYDNDPVNSDLLMDNIKGIHRGRFTPHRPGLYKVEVLLEGNPVIGSPFICTITALSGISMKVMGLDLIMVNDLTSFEIVFGKDIKDKDKEKLDIEILSPKNRKLQSTVSNYSTRSFIVEFVPTVPGIHEISVHYHGKHIIGSPFRPQVIDPSSIIISPTNQIGTVGEPLNVIVDTIKAGVGKLDVRVWKGDKEVETRITEVGQGMNQVIFTPDENKPHEIKVIFNGINYDNCSLIVPVIDKSLFQILGEGMSYAAVNQPSTFKVIGSKLGHGNLSVNITSMTDDSVIPAIITNSFENNESGMIYDVEYITRIIGDYRAEVRYGKSIIGKGPFVIKSFDPMKVRVLGLVDAFLGMKSKFAVDASSAGEGNMVIAIELADNRDLKCPCHVDVMGSLFEVRFMPLKVGKHRVNVYFNDRPIGGNPFAFNVLDLTSIILERSTAPQGLTPVNRNVKLCLKVPHCDPKDFRINIKGPNDENVPAKITFSSNDSLEINFVPTSEGEHQVEVTYKGQPITGFPQILTVWDINKVKVSEIGTVRINKTTSFELDGSRAGSGQLEVFISDESGKNLPIKMNSSRPGQYCVTFTPRNLSQHWVEVKFNQEHIPGSPFRCKVIDPSKCVAQWNDIKCIPINKKARLEVNFNQPLATDIISASVIGPSGDRLSTSLLPLVTNGKSGKGAVLEFYPITAGQHRIEMSVLDDPIPGSAFISDVFDVSKVKVEGLEKDEIQLKKPVEFYVRTSGPGKIRARVKSQGEKSLKIVMACKELSPGLTKYLFTPVDESDHVVELTCNDHPIIGFPKLLKVFNPEPSKPIPVEASSQYEPFTREISSATQTNLNVNYDTAQVIITAPNGQIIKGQLIRQPTGDYKIDYMSPYVGRHKVEVILDEEHIMDSPYYIDLHDSSKVDIISAKQKWIVDKPIDFEVVTIKAGTAHINVKVLEPNGNSLPIEEEATLDGRRVTYIPRLVGPHRAFVTFGGEPVPGGNPLVQEVIKPSQAVALGSGLTKGLKDEPSRFFVDGKNQKGDLTVQVDGPNSIAKVNIESVQNGAYNVTYIPVEVGHFDVFVRWNGRDIPGSPFSPKIVDPSKVKTIGSWDKDVDPVSKVMNLLVGVVNKIELDSKSAGPGELAAEVMNLRSRVNVPVDVVRMDEDRFMVAFVPTEMGDYLIRILWEDHLIPICPITGNAKSCTSFSSPSQTSWIGSSPLRANGISAAKVVVSGRALKEVTVGQMAEFIIDGTNGGQGEPKVKLSGKNIEIPIKVECINKSLYRCSYEPRFPGKNILNVDWSDEPVKGSPFEVNILEASDASKVMCMGEGLRKGILNQDVRAIIDTSQAGPGSLETRCMGPSTAATTTLRDHRDGTYTLFIKPQELGKHWLEIKYSGRHVTGSPFHLKVYSPPDPTKVAVYGPGVRHGLLADFRSHFFVDTTGAGVGQLTVRVKGPKGAFCVEMQRDNQKDRLITCRYDPSEKGEYIVQVKWSDIDISGSPFLVRIVETKEELDEAFRTLPILAEISPNEGYEPYPYLRNSKGLNNNPLDRISRTGKGTFIKKGEDPFYETHDGKPSGSSIA